MNTTQKKIAEILKRELINAKTVGVPEAITRVKIIIKSLADLFWKEDVKALENASEENPERLADLCDVTLFLKTTGCEK